MNKWDAVNRGVEERMVLPMRSSIFDRMTMRVNRLLDTHV